MSFDVPMCAKDRKRIGGKCLIQHPGSQSTYDPNPRGLRMAVTHDIPVGNGCITNQ
jgi:hypothetical protein